MRLRNIHSLLHGFFTWNLTVCYGLIGMRTVHLVRNLSRSLVPLVDCFCTCTLLVGSIHGCFLVLGRNTTDVRSSKHEFCVILFLVFSVLDTLSEHFVLDLLTSASDTFLHLFFHRHFAFDQTHHVVILQLVQLRYRFAHCLRITDIPVELFLFRCCFFLCVTCQLIAVSIKHGQFKFLFKDFLVTRSTLDFLAVSLILSFRKFSFCSTFLQLTAVLLTLELLEFLGLIKCITHTATSTQLSTCVTQSCAAGKVTCISERTRVEPGKTLGKFAPSALRSTYISTSLRDFS